jgi:two-component system, OmpR family, KDP operon response regulator KdpE
MKVLIIDDEPVIRDALGRRLQREGFNVLMAGRGIEGLKLFHIEKPDLVILDVVMPDMDGMTLCKRIREVGETPILMLSGNAITEQDIVEALNAGADEYLVKPIRLSEFVARVQALLRRVLPPTPDGVDGYDDGFLHVDRKHRKVHVNGMEIHVTPMEFKVLVVLMDNAGRIVTRNELLEKVWGQEADVDVYYPRLYINQLRSKIELDPADPLYIVTEHGIGYRFEKKPYV